MQATLTPIAARLSLIAATGLLAACSSMGPAPAPVSQDSLPDPIKVPAGNRLAWETTTVGGEITYECRDRAQGGGQEWVFVGPEATLNDRAGRRVGRYYGPPATWESADGSKLTATQVAIAPAAAGSIPLQLVKANPAMGAGAMTGVSYIQRVATKGGVAPASACDAGSRGRRETVRYQADYIFYRAG